MENTIETPLLSIVVPVYGTEKYLSKCLNSIFEQSYPNLEVIIVDDASKGNCKEIVEEYIKKDHRIRYILHEQNKGLFRARVTGSEVAQGEYITFVDSDDYLSLDFYRLMIKKAEDGDFDIVANSTIHKNPDGSFYQLTLHKIGLDKVLRGENVRNNYFEQAGSCYAWHTVWNKIYKKTLWDKCLPEYKKLNDHIIMTEDIAFSSILFFNAKSFASIDNGAYYYCKHEMASTNTNNIDYINFEKNMKDIANVFDFIEEYLKNNNASLKVMKGLERYRKHYAQMWDGLRSSLFSKGKYSTAAKNLVDNIACLDGVERNKNLYFFDQLSSDLYDGLEELRMKISSSGIKVVSFDIFDTLVLRSVWEPEDIFRIMQKSFEEICPQLHRNSFLFLRQEAERICREKNHSLYKGYQDVTLSEIYESFQEYFEITERQREELKKLEETTELSLIRVRNTGKSLLDFAVSVGKQVVFTSDMYLEKRIIETMLGKCGYKEFPLFLSSDIRLVKFNRGDLFEYITQQLDVEPREILHIGDNWNVDILNAAEKGLETGFLPKTKDVFCNSYAFNSTNSLAIMGNIVGSHLTSWNAMYTSLPHRSMLALVANELFDNPFNSWNRSSDFDANPYVMGYYTMGMHLIGVCVWLAKLVKERKAKGISFLARDGYLPKAAFEYLNKYLELEEVKLNYVPCSRKALMPWIIEDESGLFNLPVNYYNHSPESILDLLSCCCKDDEKEKIKELGKLGIKVDHKFQDRTLYRKFIKWFSKNLYSSEVLEKNKNIVANYYRSVILEGDVVFDLGYSGRIPAALSKCLGHSVTYAYIHAEYGSIEHYIRRENLDLHTMYDFVPVNRDLIRELFFSEQNNQCIGIEENSMKSKPIFSSNEVNYSELFVFRKIMEGTLSFIKDFISAFSSFIDYREINPIFSSMPFEGLLASSSEEDRRVFMTTASEDTVYGNLESINITDFWNSLPDDSACTRRDYTMNVSYSVGIPSDGAIGRLYQEMNRLLPMGSKRREWVRKTANKIITK